METEEYTLMLEKYGDTKVAALFLKDRDLKMKLGTSVLLSYDGKVWIKMSGGKAITSAQMSWVLPEVQRRVTEYFEQ